ncbi:hypothetical protein ACN077_23740 [Clostridium chromiireducens]|uniref:hypothetical protein n=1 Tax=Clostridium chromiireducens TaxID=225345 RepID=UPI003AF87B13
MSNNTDNLFNNMGLSDQDISYYKNQYKRIQIDFKNKKFDFNRLKNDRQYINVLKEYLKYNGYGYLFKTISKLSSDGKVDIVKMAKLLIDSNLIHKPDIKLNSKIQNKEIINYKKEFGLIEKFPLNYVSYDFPFKINDVDYGNKDHINCEIISSNSIMIGINIEKDEEVNFTEVIVIYTSYGVEKLEFSIKCDKNLKSLINLKDFDEFINICKCDYDKAFKIYKKEIFREWLEKKRYVTQIINYDEALSISRRVNNKSFEVFCALNKAYPAKLNKLIEKEIMDSNDISSENDTKEFATPEVNIIKEKDIEVLNVVENTVKKNHQNAAITIEEIKDGVEETLENKTGKIRKVFDFIKNIFYKKNRK